HRLGRRTRQRVGALAERGTGATGLDGVVQLRGRAVVGHGVDLFHGAGRTLDGAANRRDDLGAFGVHLHAVVGVARRVVAFDGRVDLGAAGTGAILALHHIHPGAFAEHETGDAPVPATPSVACAH